MVRAYCDLVHVNVDRQAKADASFAILRSRPAFIAAWPNGIWPRSSGGFCKPRPRSCRRDDAAITAALTMSWSPGQCERRICRVKLIKRLGYVRAYLDLLRQRILHRIIRPLQRAGTDAQVRPLAAAAEHATASTALTTPGEHLCAHRPCCIRSAKGHFSLHG